jgi:predicted PurR-regulated permease PerM
MSAPTTAPRRRLLAVDSAPAQRRAGRVMVGVAVVGVAVALIGAIVGWQLVGQIDSTTTDTLDVSVESLDSLADTIELADGVLTSTTESLDAVASTLTTVSESFGSATDVLTEFSTFAETAGPALEDTTGILRQLEDVGTTVDEALGAV